MALSSNSYFITVASGHPSSMNPCWAHVSWLGDPRIGYLEEKQKKCDIVPDWQVCSGACQRSDLKTVGVISGRCDIASSLVGLDWIDLRLRARSLPLGADACRNQGRARLPRDISKPERSSVRSPSSSQSRWHRAVPTGAAPKIYPRDPRRDKRG